MQPIEIWFELRKWALDERLDGDKEKSKRIYKISDKYERIQLDRIFSRR